MKLMDAIRSRLRARQTDAATQYWGLVAKLANGQINDRAAAAASDEIEKALPALGKNIDDIEIDIALMHEFEAARIAAEQARAQQSEIGKLRGKALQVDRRVQEILEELPRLRNEAESVRQRANALDATIRQAEQQIAETGRRLAAAGHPDALANRSAQEREREIQALQGELNNLDRGVSTTNDAPSERRSAIGARLAELGVSLEQAQAGQ